MRVSGFDVVCKSCGYDADIDFDFDSFTGKVWLILRCEACDLERPVRLPQGSRKVHT